MLNENAGGYPTLNIENSAFHITHFVLHLAGIQDKAEKQEAATPLRGGPFVR